MREKWYAYAAALGVPVVYYGVSIVLGNVTFTGEALGAAAAYFPWTLLQGGLEEVGWRWYLQPRLNVKNSYLLKLLVLSVIWFVWHFPIYRLPWVTTASSNYLIFYLLILGNTFTLGAVRELSRGSIPCILAHMLVDTGAFLLLVDSTLYKIIALVVVEILISVVVIQVFRKKQFAFFSK